MGAKHRERGKKVMGILYCESSIEIYKSIIQYNPDGIFVLSIDGIIMEVNQVIMEMLGYPKDELEGVHYQEFLVPEYVEFTNQQFAKVLKGTSCEYETKALDKNGEAIFLQVKNIPLMDKGKMIGIFSVCKDITELREAKTALYYLQERLKSFFNLTGDAIDILDLDGNVVDVNPAFEKIYGWSRNEIIGKSLQIIPSYRWTHQKNMVKQVKQGISINGLETTCIKKDGTIIDVSLTLSPIRDENGNIVGTSGITRNITKQKQLENSLKVSEKRYKTLVEHSPVPIAVYQGGVIQYANPACIKLLGLKYSEEVIGKTITEYFRPDFIHSIEKRNKELNQIGVFVPPTEEKIIRVDGTLVDVEVTGITIDHDGKPAFLVMYHDITRRKRAEDALRKSESEYRLIAENTQDYIRVLDVNGIILYASPSHESILGFQPNFYKGQWFYELMHPDDIPKTKEQFFQIISTKSARQVEFRYKHSNGGWVYVESFGSPVLNEQGEVTSIVIVGRDISERKKAEEVIRESEKLSVVGELAAGVAHEIRNPLTSIKGFIQLQKELNNPCYTDLIISEINRIEAIVGEFLTLAKPQVPNFKEVGVNILLDHVMLLFDSQALLNNVEFLHEVDSDLPLIYCDKNQMKQVFINILQNAVEAMPNGGAIKIEVSQSNSDSIRFRFIDQGYGISEERMKHIGEPFYSTKEKGTGLGLTISKKILQEHGGTMTIESTLNQGTTVDVILPIHVHSL
jgi:PAS domain S-box-containing protein